jgi:integrase
VKSVPSYLTVNRCGIFYFQYRIPTNFIRNGTTRKLFRKSLHTRDRRHALKLARRWAVWMDDLATRFFKHPESFGKAMELLMTFKGMEDHWESVEHFLMGLDDREEHLLSDAIEYDRICKESHHHLAEQNETLKRAIEVLHSRIGTNSSPAQQPLDPSLDAPLLSELIDAYLEDVSLGWDAKHFEGNDRDLRPRLDLIVEIIGDKRCDAITREDVRKFKEVTMKLPSNRKKKAAYRDKSISELMEMKIPEGDLLSPKSINKNLEKASSFFKWCRANSTFVSDELWHPLNRRVNDDVPEDEQRDAFTDEDLRRLFLSKQYLNGTHKHPSHFWVPLLALFTGARQNELCQLYKSDIYQDSDSGIWVINLNDKSIDKKLKKRNHGRIVPVHPKLIELGFLKFVESINEERIFNELARMRGGYQHSLSNWFNRTYRSQNHCDVGNRPNEKKNFHSFRHTVINQLEKKDVSPPQIARLVGQKPSDGTVTTSRYGKKNNIEDNYEIIAKLEYPIDFGKVKKWRI